jgi:acyl-CoA synthetase (AMP-forming)/AMP-acid ligase II
MRGATILPVAVFNVADVLSLVDCEHITVLPGVPTLYRSSLDDPDCDRYGLTSLRVAVTGAADIPVALIEQMDADLPFTSILTGYGLTEAGTVTGRVPEPDEVVAWSRERMANCKAPRSVRVIDSLPLNPAGKVVKDELRTRALDELSTS